MVPYSELERMKFSANCLSRTNLSEVATCSLITNHASHDSGVAAAGWLLHIDEVCSQEVFRMKHNQCDTLDLTKVALVLSKTRSFRLAESGCWMVVFFPRHSQDVTSCCFLSRLD